MQIISFKMIDLICIFSIINKIKFFIQNKKKYIARDIKKYIFIKLKELHIALYWGTTKKRGNKKDLLRSQTRQEDEISSTQTVSQKCGHESHAGIQRTMLLLQPPIILPQTHQ